MSLWTIRVIVLDNQFHENGHKQTNYRETDLEVVIKLSLAYPHFIGFGSYRDPTTSLYVGNR